MRIFSGVVPHAGKAGAMFLLAFKEKLCTRITQKQLESPGFHGILCYSVRIKYRSLPPKHQLPSAECPYAWTDLH